jgi:two-component system phosphate regulon sensor histidine kinase PhoR
MKNASLPKVALIASLLVVFAFGIQLALLFFLQWTFHWYILVGFIIVSFFSSYGIIYYLVDGFIYRRVKLIYKNIHQLKSGKASGVLQTNDPLSEVEAEVQAFSQSRSSEIEELKKMEQYRREFLGDVSHELKTPIFNTQGYIETLLNGALDNPKVNTSYLKKASKNLDRLSSIVDNLLMISENETGNLKLNLKKFNIVDLIEEVFESHEMSADVKDIALKQKAENPKSKMVLADRAQIETVLNNLVINAIKYGKEEGIVLVGIYTMGDHILVEVTDDGPGIEQQHLPRLFDRFYRIDSHRSRYEGGNGLGLSICKHIIDAHGQTIHVRSTINVGTTFGFTLAKA